MTMKAINLLHEPLRTISKMCMSNFLRCHKADASIRFFTFGNVEEPCSIAHSLAATINAAIVSILCNTGGTRKTKVTPSLLVSH